MIGPGLPSPTVISGRLPALSLVDCRLKALPGSRWKQRVTACDVPVRQSLTMVNRQNQLDRLLRLMVTTDPGREQRPGS